MNLPEAHCKMNPTGGYYQCNQEKVAATLTQFSGIVESDPDWEKFLEENLRVLVAPPVNYGITWASAWRFDCVARKKFTIKFPKDWWQAFRSRWLPSFWLSRHPVLYHHVELLELLPEIVTEKQRVVMFQRDDSKAG